MGHMLRRRRRAHVAAALCALGLLAAPALDPGGSPRYFQGSIGTHGLHLLFLADSDNARQTVPLTEIVSEWRMVMLPGRGTGAEGEQYGRGFEKPLVSVVGLAQQPPAPDGGGGGGGGTPGGGPGNGGGGGGNPGGGGTGPGTGPPATAPAAATKPASRTVTRSVRLLLARTARVRRGALAIRCAVRGAGARGCAIKVLAGRRVIGTGSARSKGGTVAVAVRLTPAGRRLVARARRGLTVRITATATYAAGRTSTTARVRLI